MYRFLKHYTVTQTAPTLSSNVSYPGVYTFALVDLAIPYKVVNTTDFASLVPGDSNLGANRTTRLHWWMDNVTQAADGTFSGNSTLADYEGPQPPAGDVPHEYTIFLFNRPSSFVPMANSEAFYDASTYNGDDRMNFSVPALAAQLGNPIASRYFTVVRGNGTATAAGNTTTSKPTSTAMPYTGAASRVGMTVSGLGLVALVSALLL